MLDNNLKPVIYYLLLSWCQSHYYRLLLNLDTLWFVGVGNTSNGRSLGFGTNILLFNCFITLVRILLAIASIFEGLILFSFRFESFSLISGIFLSFLSSYPIFCFLCCIDSSVSCCVNVCYVCWSKVRWVFMWVKVIIAYLL